MTLPHFVSFNFAHYACRKKSHRSIACKPIWFRLCGSNSKRKPCTSPKVSHLMMCINGGSSCGLSNQYNAWTCEKVHFSKVRRCTSTYAHPHMHIHTCTFTHPHSHIHIHTSTHTQTCMHNTCVHASVASTHTTHPYTHAHTHIHKQHTYTQHTHTHTHIIRYGSIQTCMYIHTAMADIQQTCLQCFPLRHP